MQKRACQCLHMHPDHPPHRALLSARHDSSREASGEPDRDHPAGRRPTGPGGIRDVAAAAGVSITTVSDALNGKGRLPDATRRHVREVADRLGYRPSAAARTLRTGKSGLIGLTVTTYGEEPFTFTEFAYFAEMARAATSAALARGYALVILPATSRHDVWSNVALDGTVVIDPSDHDPVVTELVRQGLPVVSDGRPAGSSPSPPGSTTTTRPPYSACSTTSPPPAPPDRTADQDHHRHLHPTLHHRLPQLVRARRPGPGLRVLPRARPVRGRRRRRPAPRPPRPARRGLRALRPQRHRSARRRPPLRPARPRGPAARVLQRVHRLREHRAAHHHPVPQTPPHRHRRRPAPHRRDRGVNTGRPVEQVVPTELIIRTSSQRRQPRTTVSPPRSPPRTDRQTVRSACREADPGPSEGHPNTARAPTKDRPTISATPISVENGRNDPLRKGFTTPGASQSASRIPMMGARHHGPSLEVRRVRRCTAARRWWRGR